MANVMFKKGPSSRVPYTSGAIEGAFYLTEDTNKLYVGTSEGKAVLVGKQITTIPSLTVNPNTGKYDLPAGHQNEFLYIEDENIFAVWKDGVLVQINQNTDTTYDLTLDGSATNKVVVKLDGKDIKGNKIEDESEEFGIVGGDNVSVTVNTDGNIEIDVDLSAYDTIESVNGKVGAVQDEVDALKEYVGTFKAEDDENVKTVVDYVDALKEYVGTFTASEGVETVVNYIDAKTEKVNGIDNRVKTLEETTIPALEQDIADALEIAEAATTVDEVNDQIDTKIAALKLSETYEPIGAEDRAKGYVDQKFTDANLEQYTTEQEVKDIVDGVIAAAVENDTIENLTDIVEYLATHGGEYSKLLGTVNDHKDRINDHEDRIDVIEAKPAHNITSTQVTNWDNEVGTKTAFESYVEAHKNDYTNAQVDSAIDADVKTAIDAEVERANGAYDTKGAAAEAQAAAIADAVTKYETIGTAQGIVDGLKLSETYEPIGAETRANGYTDEKLADYDLSTEVDTKIENAINGALEWGSF